MILYVYYSPHLIMNSLPLVLPVSSGMSAAEIQVMPPMSKYRDRGRHLPNLKQAFSHYAYFDVTAQRKFYDTAKVFNFVINQKFQSSIVINSGLSKHHKRRDDKHERQHYVADCKVPFDNKYCRDIGWQLTDAP